MPKKRLINTKTVGEKRGVTSMKQQNSQQTSMLLTLPENVFSGFAFVHIVTNSGIVLYSKGIEDALMSDVDPVLLGGFVAALSEFTKAIVKGDEGALRLIDMGHFKVLVERSNKIIGLAVTDKDRIAVRTVLREIVHKIEEIKVAEKLDENPDRATIESMIDRIVMDVLMRKSINQELMEKLKAAEISFKEKFLQKRKHVKELLEKLAGKGNDIVIRL